MSAIKLMEAEEARQATAEARQTRGTVRTEVVAAILSAIKAGELQAYRTDLTFDEIRILRAHGYAVVNNADPIRNENHFKISW